MTTRLQASDIKIRHYSDGDEALLRSMIARLREHEISVDPSCQPWTPAVADTYLADVLGKLNSAEGLIVFAEDETGAVGFSIAYAFVTDEIFLKEDERRYIYISDVYLTPEARRKGAAFIMTDYIEQYYRRRGHTKLRCVVLANNAGMNKFIPKAGYKPYEIIYEKRLSA